MQKEQLWLFHFMLRWERNLVKIRLLLNFPFNVEKCAELKFLIESR